MAKLYAKKKLVTTDRVPKKATVAFLLNYSKALNVYKTDSFTIEFIAN